jgi:hypothetical protein
MRYLLVTEFTKITQRTTEFLKVWEDAVLLRLMVLLFEKGHVGTCVARTTAVQHKTTAIA